MNKELRFTRGGQAVSFVGAGILMLSVAGGLVMLAVFPGKPIRPVVPTPWLGLLPLPVAAALFWQAARLARHPYLALTPIGLEIHPFFRPEKHTQLVPWSEIGEIAVDDEHRQLVVVFAGVKNAKIFISLDPMRQKSRELLRRAVEGTAENLRRARGLGNAGTP